MGLSFAFSTVVSAYTPQTESAHTSRNKPFQRQYSTETSPLDAPIGDIKLLTSDETGLLLEFYTPEFRVSEIQTPSGLCQLLSLEGYSSFGSPGSPELPVSGLSVGIPPDADPTLTVLTADYVDLPLHYNICPAIEPQAALGIDGQIQFNGYIRTRDPLVYETKHYKPSVPAELVSTAYIRSQRVTQVRIQPFQYNPTTGQLRYIRHLRLRLDYSIERSSMISTGSFIDEGPFEDILKNILLNYDQARDWRLPAKAIARQSELDAFDPPEPAYKLFVEQDGLYQVSYADLQSAGLPVRLYRPTNFSDI